MSLIASFHATATVYENVFRATPGRALGRATFHFWKMKSNFLYQKKQNTAQK